MKIVIDERPKIIDFIERVVPTIICRYYNYNYVDNYRLNSFDRELLKETETKLNILYLKLINLFDYEKLNCFKNFEDLKLYIKSFIKVINKIYDDFTIAYCTYYHVDINYVNIAKNIDLNSYYLLLNKKKKEYYYNILKNEVLNYKDNRWYMYVYEDLNNLIYRYKCNYSNIDSNILNEFNEKIKILLNYYDRNYQEDIIDLKRLKSLHIISEEDYGYLENYAGLWSYHKERDKVLSKKS